MHLSLTARLAAAVFALFAVARGATHAAFRPHSVLLAERPGDPTHHWSPARVAEREFLGEFIRYRLEASGREVIADLPHALGTPGFAQGAIASLGIDRTQVRRLGD